MIFKHDWEKMTSPPTITDPIIKAMLAMAMPNNTLHKYEVIAGGCANLNILLHLGNSINQEYERKILRIYLRKPDSVYKEQALARLIQDIIPIPHIYYIGDYAAYRFAITQYMPGITLRDFLLHHKHEDFVPLMLSVGKTLAKLQQYKFAHAGFFDFHLNISQQASSHDYFNYIINCLQQQNIIEYLNEPMIANIKLYLEKNSQYMPSDNNPSLVHGDYDPSNILVNKINGQWQISAILDWEFAFAGSFLHDIANMLRYSHKMPNSFTTAFLEGTTSAGITMPSNWQITINLLNIGAMLDTLINSDLQSKPIRCQDIKALLTNILANDK